MSLPRIKIKQSFIILSILGLSIVGVIPVFFILFSQDFHPNNLESVRKLVVAVGKLDYKKEIPVRFMSRGQLKQYVSDIFDVEYTPEASQKDGKFLYLMGFEKEEPDLIKIRKRIILDYVGGVYSERNKELAALNEYRDFDLFHNMVIFHELRHGIQDQYFDIQKLLGNYSIFDDRQLSVLAALEGDATFLMLQCSRMDSYTMSSGSNNDALLSFSPIAKPSAMSGAYPAVKGQLIMPYVDGLRFVDAIYQKRRWKNVNKILTNPPTSTEQILHPEKYIKREQPINVDILYKPLDLPLYHSGVIGEYFINLLLKPSEALDIRDFAMGWGGDIFSIFQNNTTSSMLLIWKSVWDKEEYCSRFYTDFKQFIEKKFSVEFKEGKSKGKEIPFVAGKSRLGEDYFFLTKIKSMLFYARTDSRNQMNTLINGGEYD